jgi:molybdopterin converting factor subunit 1
MKITLLAFGIAKEIVGHSLQEMELDENITQSNFRIIINAKHPALGALSTYAIAINKTYAQPDDVIKHGDEVAILPPVSGG